MSDQMIPQVVRLALAVQTDLNALGLYAVGEVDKITVFRESDGALLGTLYSLEAVAGFIDGFMKGQESEIH